MPQIGSGTGGNGLIVGCDEGEIRLHVFDSRSQARELIARYREGMRDQTYVDDIIGRLRDAYLVDRSDTTPFQLEGFMALKIYDAFDMTGRDERDQVQIIDNLPRVCICFLDPSCKEGLCAWRGLNDWNVAHFFSRAHTAALVGELQSIMSPEDLKSFQAAMVACGLPETSEYPMARCCGHAAGLICHAFEEMQYTLGLADRPSTTLVRF